MKLGIIDISVIFGYLMLTVVIGLVLRKRAQKDKSAYLLGGNRLPWYMLGLSNASGMFDISGTMWLVTITFVYGLKSVWIPWLWPVFNQIFLMVFLSVWVRRSNVTTGAEWIGTRFGKGRDAAMSHAVVVVFALITCLGYLAYGFIGLGKFVQIFIPWSVVQPYIPFHIPAEYVPHIYGIIFTFFAVFYSVLGGMSGIVWADVLQYLIMTVSAIVIAIIAMSALGNSTLNVPDGWMNPFFGWKLHMDWSHIIAEVNEKIASDGYSLFSIFFSMMLFKGVLVSLAGPAPNYDLQKILSTKSPKEAAMMSGFVSVVLMPVRYLMIAGFAVLALLYYNKLNLVVAGHIDFEQILPSAINQFVPVGFTGLLLAGLLAAFMSTFAGTLNAAQAYIVNDIYLKYLNPKASRRQINVTTYTTGVLVVIVSIFFGIFATDVNSILQWIVSALYGSYVASNVLKWYWWRFNGHGFFWGMVAGMVPALVFPYIFTETLDLYYFPLILIISVAGSIIGTYMAPPTDEETLKSFYKSVRPWGFWKPVHELVMADDPGFRKNKNFYRDMFNVVLGIIAQTGLVLAPIYLVLKKNLALGISLAIVAVIAIIMKKTWWDKLVEEEAQMK
ncbi:sodium:solute symporter family protein [Prolixibacter denitrificans]|uniref:Na+/proline symporter n=1 Tax=Prolixibacter denitrificans TaxID=1541063 RepID=A0A2P8CH74_9BACT|nr:sodium:solute symporter family protein [Prolixibacter denitrificans]PSK84259.1 Na+/proline symporter [Prolixibacter denitrificans]GET20434.1 sodium:solute symporter [Prolixibacter denitrificans]